MGGFMNSEHVRLLPLENSDHSTQSLSVAYFQHQKLHGHTLREVSNTKEADAAVVVEMVAV